MKKSFKYYIKGNKETIEKANQVLELCRILYNLCLEQRQFVWKNYHKSISGYDQVYELPSLKKFFPQFRKVPSQTLQEVVERVNRAFQNFFRRVNNGEKPGYPRFKSFGRYDSLTLKQAGWKLVGKELQISKIGDFKLFLSRPIEGDIKTVTIRRASSDKWHATFSCDNVLCKPLPKTGKSVGIDVGCESFLTTSEGEKIDNPRFFQRTKKLLTKRQRSLSRKKRGSKRRNKARILLSKAHEKTYNQRRDFHFKVARKLLQAYDVVCIENMSHFKSYRSLNRSMRDVAWFGFFNILLFKAEEAGKEVIKVPAKNTSQLCSECGGPVPKSLSVRIHKCPHCGLSLDRDINAARNILRLGQSLQGAGALVPAMN
ncbi:MAG: transposase [Clostridia bacterium]|nr:transposase [Clostridia bacterium]